MVVVSDTTTVSNLFLIDKLWILETLYGNILIPTAVFDELKKLEQFGWNINSIANAHWIEVKEIVSFDMVAVLSEVLDLGESEAIILALENKADLLIIDETKGRHYAKKLNINIVGCVGILIEARQKGIIENLGNILVELQNKAGFWLKPELINKALFLVNEKAKDE